MDGFSIQNGHTRIYVTQGTPECIFQHIHG